MVKIKIKIDREIFQRSANCKIENAGNSCAFAIAFRDLFPDANIKRTMIFPSASKSAEWSVNSGVQYVNVMLAEKEKIGFGISEEMTEFIDEFDCAIPEKRIKMEEKEFEINIPDWALEHIDITDVKRIIENSSHLELV